MASLRQRPNGIYEIQFRDEHKQKKTITLSGGKYSADTATALRRVVGVLIDKKINDDPRQHRPTKAWVEAAPLEIREKLARHGLWTIQARHTTQALWDTFFERHRFKCASTERAYRNVRARFFWFFKPTESIDTLTQERMRDWKRFLLDDRNLAEATVAGTLDKTKAVFAFAKERHWITDSPLHGVGSGSYRNEEKDRIVTPAEYRRLLDACPCQEWRVIITLARIGGLRPCEILTLRWSDIDWEQNWFTVYSPKLKGKRRDVPLFPEIVVELRTFHSMPGNEDQEYIVNRYVNRITNNFVHSFNRIARRAGIGKVPRPFDNMRMSRSNEIRQQYGTKLENLWIGHSAKIADAYYTIATETDYAIAAGKSVNQSVGDGFTAQTTDVMTRILRNPLASVLTGEAVNP